MPRPRFVLFALAPLLTTGAAEARLVRLVIESRTAEPLVPGGLPYEMLKGHFEGEADPRDRHNRIITDIAAAPKNARGKVSYSATFAIARPINGDGSGVLFYDVPNRGRSRISDRDGDIRVVSGWQGDISPSQDMQTATVPVASGPRGRPLTGPVLARFVNMPEGSTTLSIRVGLGSPVARPAPVSLDTRRARLMRQANDAAPLEAISAADWAFADCQATPFPGKPNPEKLCLRGGFDPRYAYTLVYEGKDPRILGLGFAATRDLVSFLRYADKDDDGTPNPVRGQVRWSVASGTSQSGNFLRSFVHLGFNADEQDRRTFDVINPNIAARHVPLNIRFGVPGGAADLFEVGSEGALWWGRYEDKIRGRGVTSLLTRCSASRTCPKVMETFGSAEFWGLRMSPDLVGTDARGDIALPDTVRRYYFPGVTHGGSIAGGISLNGDRPWPGAPRCIMAMNPNPSTPTLRALTQAMIAWVRDGREPPPSRYPTIANGDLVPPTASAMGWPAIPGAPSPDGKINPFYDYDLGNAFRYVDVSGIINRQPPRVRRMIPQRIPRVDADGNETSGVPSVQHLVPLGTYTGWNVMAQGYGAGGGCGFSGGFIPFATTRTERLAHSDPRPSLEERYGDHDGFVAQISSAAERQVREGWLLQEDADRIIREAEASSVLKPAK
ncbi:MAG TPA: alpha/beta hydrolase domain-containing protein [Sphingobium sp.]|uniref:alpha/beta hydrolase domain-containing protein n=1 Tax=Sphingobium sp. TaxID=1912891 RepID=UPI002ED04D53